MYRSKQLTQVIDAATDYAEWRHTTVQTHHLLYALMQVPNDATKYLNEFHFTLDRVKSTDGSKTLDNPIGVERIYVAANIYAQAQHSEEITCTHLLLALLSYKDNNYAYDKISYMLEGSQYTTDAVFRRIVADLGGDRVFGKAVIEWLAETNGKRQGSAYSPAAAALKTAEKTSDASVADDESDPLARYGYDMTAKAMAGGFDPIIGRDNETERLIQTLTRRTKNNPVLVGEAGVGKTAVVEGLAAAIADKRVPAELQNKKLIQLDIASMLAGTRYRGDFEERLTEIVRQVVEQGDIILFIDEIHNMVGAGGTGNGSIDAAEILKPSLARGELHIIGATTTREYRLYIEKDPALERRFQPITVDEPSPELAVQIVKGVKGKYEKHHGITISDEAIREAVQLSVRYITDRCLPDKAFDVIDEACSKLKISVANSQPQYDELALQTEDARNKAEFYRNNGNWEYADFWQRKYDEMRIKQLQASAQHRDPPPIVLTAEHVRDIISQMTGVPVSELSRAEKDKLLHLEEELSARVIGQDEAVRVVSRAVRRQRAGLKDPNRPIGSFIFVGPTGVGKTELAKALSQCLFGSNTEVIRIDMSEYMDKTSVAKLIGAPPGYVGYEESGYLTEKVLRRPYSVVLFDEVEKAHPDVFNLLLQILDEGRLTDSHGKTVDFRNTVIILTSNIGITDNAGNSVGFGSRDDNEVMRGNVERALKRFFRPEFLNRLDEIVVFNYLGERETVQIAKLMCYRLYKRLKGTINLKFTERAIATLAQAGYDRNFGARPLKRAIQRNIEDALAEKMLTGEINRNDNVLVDSVNGEIIFDRE